MYCPMAPDARKALPPMLAASPADSQPTPCRISTRQLFEMHAAFTLRLVRRLGVHESDMEDVAQEVFLIAHRRIADLDAEANPRNWLFGIARRVVANYLRKSHRVRERPSQEVVSSHGDPAAEMDLRRARALLEQALDRLDQDKRTVFVLFELEGLPMHEVAEMVGCRLHTAYSRLYAARMLVRRRVLVAHRESRRQPSSAPRKAPVPR